MYTVNEMNELPGKDLIAIHNTLVPTEAAIGQWKSAKTKLVTKILALGYEPTPKQTEEVTPKGAIKRKAVELLCEVVGQVDRKTGKPTESTDFLDVYTVGHPYKAVLALLLEEFPEAKTTLGCLRWYAVKLRNSEEGYEGHTLPQKRPSGRKATA